MEKREPGDKGSMQGQIKTPMCSENVDNQGGGGSGSSPKVHSYKNTMNLDAAGPSKGAMKTDSKIEGPGAKGNWDTQIKISGSNVKRKY